MKNIRKKEVKQAKNKQREQKLSEINYRTVYKLKVKYWHNFDTVCSNSDGNTTYNVLFMVYMVRYCMATQVSVLCIILKQVFILCPQKNGISA